MSPNSFTSMESSHRAAQIGASGNAGNAGNSSMAGGGKAFSNYRPTSDVSPYMNMFRGNDAAGTIDNYTTLVRPQLDAQQQSVMTGNDISALQAQSSQNPLAMPLRPQTQSGTIDGGMGSQNYLNYEQTPNAQQNPAYQQQTPPITP